MSKRRVITSISLGIAGIVVCVGSAVGVTAMATASAPTPSTGLNAEQTDVHEIDPNSLTAAGSTANGEYFTALSTKGQHCFVIMPAADPGTVVSSCATDEKFAAHGIGLSVDFADGRAVAFGAYFVPAQEVTALSEGSFTAVSESVIEGSIAAVTDPSDASDARSNSTFSLLPLGGIK